MYEPDQLSFDQPIHDNFQIRSNVTVETVPRPVQISELLENGLFYTSTGEKAIPSQVCSSYLLVFSGYLLRSFPSFVHFSKMFQVTQLIL